MRYPNNTALVIMALSLAPCSVTAQVDEVAENITPYTAFERIVPIGQNWAVAYLFHGLSIRNDEGQLLNTIHTPMWISPTTTEWGSMGDMIPTADGGLYLLGPFFGCDYVGMNTLMRLDTNGGILWTNEYIESTWWLSHLAQDPQDRLALVSATHVVLTDLDGMVLDEWEIDLESIRRALWTPTNDLIVASTDSLIRFNADGHATTSTGLEGVVDIRTSGSHVLVLTTDELHVLNSEFELQSSQSLPLEGGVAQEFVPGSDEVVLRTELAFWTWTEEEGIFLLFQPELAPGQRIKSAWSTDQGYFTVGDIESLQRRSGLFRSYGTDGSTSHHTEDVSVELALDSVYFEDMGWGTPGTHFYHRADVTIRLSVLGSAPITDVIISHEEYQPYMFGCEPGSRMVRLHEMELQPGTDTTFTMQGLYATGSPTPPGMLVTTEVCVVAQRPNHVADRDLSNNRACGSGTFMNTVGINDLQQSTLLVYPNPIVDHVTLAWQHKGMTRIELFDASGRQVLEKSAQGEGPITMDVSHLNNGIYHLLVRTDQEVHSRILVRSAP